VRSSIARRRSSIALRPASVIRMRTTSIVLPPAFMFSRFAVASPLRTRPAIMSLSNPCTTASSSSAWCCSTHAAPRLGARAQKRSANAPASSGLAKQNTTKSNSSRRIEYVSGGTDRVSAKPRTVSLFFSPRTLSADQRNMMWPAAAELGAVDFGLASAHRRTLRAVARRPEIAGGSLSLAGSRLRRCRPLTDGADGSLAKYS
jgi:hypothetical protein